jgi:hypothetical protein
MLFVDGEYLVTEGLKHLTADGIQPEPGAYYRKGVFLWLPHERGHRLFVRPDSQLEWRSRRSYFYASCTGSDEHINASRRELRALGFDPSVVKKLSGSQSKGVDVKLATDALMQATYGNFEVAVFVTGDADFLPVIDEVKRMGKFAWVLHLAEGMHPELRIRADFSWDFGPDLTHRWRHYLDRDRSKDEPVIAEP